MLDLLWNDPKKTPKYDTSLTYCENEFWKDLNKLNGREKKIFEIEVRMKKIIKQLSKPFSII